jgi:hypothetical protein
MNRAGKCAAIASAVAIWACQGAEEGPRVVDVEDNDLGITQLEIERRVEKGDPVLELRGLDDDGAEIALARLRRGVVMYSSDPGLAEEPSDGSELVITIGADDFKMVNASREPRTVTPPTDSPIATFIGLEAVTRELEAEAGIRFDRARPPREAAYTAGNCQDWTIASSSTHQMCCQDGSHGPYKIANDGTANAGKLGMRYVGTPCRTSGGGSCGVGYGVACDYGPCGSWGAWITGTSDAKVFVPNYPNEDLCGQDPDGVGGAAGWPDNYTNQHGVYNSVAGTCTARACFWTGYLCTTLNCAGLETSNPSQCANLPPNTGDVNWQRACPVRCAQYCESQGSGTYSQCLGWCMD